MNIRSTYHAQWYQRNRTRIRRAARRTYKIQHPTRQNRPYASPVLHGRPTDYAWAAGIIDGEGSISIDVTPQGGMLSLRVTNTSAPMLLRLQKLLDGNIGKVTRTDRRTKPTWYLDSRGRLAKTAIQTIHRYLVAKRAQADLAMKFPLPQPRRRGGNFSRKLDNAVVQRRSALRVLMHQLNRGESHP